MSDVSALAQVVKTTILDLAKQALALGAGLQAAAPTDTPSHSVQYLLAIGELLSHLSVENLKQLREIESLVKLAASRDAELRQEHQVGKKFRFIEDRLQALVSGLERSTAEITREEQEAHKQGLAADEIEIYVYLYNAHGLVLKNWDKLLHPTVFYEYSVNRPIYGDRTHVETFIKNKSNPLQHGYLTIAVKKSDIRSQAGQDTYGHPLLKIREGSITFPNCLTFTHNHRHYYVSESGALTLKEDK